MKNKIKLSNSNKKNPMINCIEFYEQFYENMKQMDDVELYRKQFSDHFYRFAKNQNQDWDKIFPSASRMAKKWN